MSVPGFIADHGLYRSQDTYAHQDSSFVSRSGSADPVIIPQQSVCYYGGVQYSLGSILCQRDGWEYSCSNYGWYSERRRC